MKDEVLDAATHSLLLGYLFWVLGFLGVHRFYFGRPVSGVLYLLTLGGFGVAWLLDLFWLECLHRHTPRHYVRGHTSYSLAWLLLVFLGIFGVHRAYMGRGRTGILFLLTGGVLLLGVIYDLCTLNQRISRDNIKQRYAMF
tara:strand:+ start:289 stop:711 length:423 start_codon:yes stop_codon:yes gene_type:complete